MAEPYAPVIDGEAVTDDTFGMILEGIVEKFREKDTYQIYTLYKIFVFYQFKISTGKAFCVRIRLFYDFMITLFV